MTHPIYDARPPIFGNSYDGEHDDEMEDMRDRFYAALDATKIATAASVNSEPDSHLAKTVAKAAAILITENEWGNGEELLVRAAAFNKWFERPLDRFLALYYLWQFGIYRETDAAFYGPFPPAVELLGQKPASYFIFNWAALLEHRFEDRVAKVLKAQGPIPTFGRSKALRKRPKKKLAVA